MDIFIYMYEREREREGERWRSKYSVLKKLLTDVKLPYSFYN